MSIWLYLDHKATENLVHAYISSKLDVNNSLLYGLPDNLLCKLQRLQNAAARIIVCLPKHSHISPTLQQLHWLPVQQRIQFKILLMVFKALNGLAPEYIMDLLVRKPHSSRSIRSNGQNLLVMPKSRTVTYGDRNFCYVGPKLWNNLPSELRQCDSLNAFKRQLKTLLFKESYD